MSTGQMINHGVSGFACTGIPGDFSTQDRGTPWEATHNDPLISYNNAQNHLGLFLQGFNQMWQAGRPGDFNMNAQPYRTPAVGSLEAPAPPVMPKIKIAPLNFPDHTLNTHPQELPSSRIHIDPILAQTARQNLDFEGGTFTGSHTPTFPQGVIDITPNTINFQGSQTAAGVHPGSDNAGQQTTGNTSKPDQPIGQQPSTKLPNGIAVGALQDSEPPPLWASAPPPDPQVLPGEGTQPLHSTNPPWW